jgi:hypothetical protein
MPREPIRLVATWLPSLVLVGHDVGLVNRMSHWVGNRERSDSLVLVGLVDL